MDDMSLPSLTGKDQVGRMSIQLRDEKRIDPYSAGKTDKRELVVWIWYPATPLLSADSKPATYPVNGLKQTLFTV
jgi:hypothetical protein